MPQAMLLSSDDEEEEDRTRAAQPPLRLVRADLDRALPEKPPASVVRRPGAALSLEELQVRARVIDRRAQELNRASKIVAAKELPPPSDAATEADETESLAAEPERWRLDLAGLAQYRLEKMGVTEVELSQQCTVTNPKQFFSYRRDRQTGRMATLAWLSCARFP